MTQQRSWLEEYLPDAGVAVLRMSIAVLIMTHAAREFFGVLLGDTAWMGSPGIFTDRWIAAVLLVAGGLLLVVGWFTRVTALALAVIVTLSWFAPSRMTGHWQVESLELIATYASVLLVLAVIGPGWFSIDAWRAGKFRARKSTMKVAISPWIKSEIRRSRLTR